MQEGLEVKFGAPMDSAGESVAVVDDLIDSTPHSWTEVAGAHKLIHQLNKSVPIGMGMHPLAWAGLLMMIVGMCIPPVRGYCVPTGLLCFTLGYSVARNRSFIHRVHWLVTQTKLRSLRMPVIRPGKCIILDPNNPHTRGAEACQIVAKVQGDKCEEPPTRKTKTTKKKRTMVKGPAKRAKHVSFALTSMMSSSPTSSESHSGVDSNGVQVPVPFNASAADLSPMPRRVMGHIDHFPGGVFVVEHGDQLYCGTVDTAQSLSQKGSNEFLLCFFLLFLCNSILVFMVPMMVLYCFLLLGSFAGFSDLGYLVGAVSGAAIGVKALQVPTKFSLWAIKMRIKANSGNTKDNLLNLACMYTQVGDNAQADYCASLAAAIANKEISLHEAQIRALKVIRSQR